MRQIDISYQAGGSIGQCQRCGGVRRLNAMALEWSGLRVCRATCLDPLPDTMRPPRGGPEGLPRPDAAPEFPNVFVSGEFNPADWPASNGQ